MKKPTVVLGLGNPLMADEGIGVYLVEQLARRASLYPEVDFLDAGDGGYGRSAPDRGPRSGALH